jgi:putative ATPase
MREAEYELLSRDRPTILFIDEIHRFNKSQQDAFLHYVESGAIVLVGATTRTPPSR